MSIPNQCYSISESGIFSHDTLSRLNNAGYQGFLVGESLMKQDNIEKAIHNLLGK